MEKAGVVQVVKLVNGLSTSRALSHLFHYRHSFQPVSKASQLDIQQKNVCLDDLRDKAAAACPQRLSGSSERVLLLPVLSPAFCFGF